MAIDKLLEELIREKARAMLGSDDYRKHGRSFASEINDVEKAFLAGALDAMSFDVAAVKNPRDLPSHEERKRLIKDI